MNDYPYPAIGAAAPQVPSQDVTLKLCAGDNCASVSVPPSNAAAIVAGVVLGTAGTLATLALLGAFDPKPARRARARH